MMIPSDTGAVFQYNLEYSITNTNTLMIVKIAPSGLKQ